MLAVLLSVFWFHLVIEQSLKQTLYVRYFTDLIWGSFGNWPVIKSDTLC